MNTSFDKHQPRTGLGEYDYEEPTGWKDVFVGVVFFSIPFFLGFLCRHLISVLN